MKTTTIIITTLALSFLLSSCDKPTSGQNTRDFRDGESGATPGTVESDTKLDSTKDRQENGP